MNDMNFSETKLREIFARVQPFTMTSYERVSALVDSVRYVTINRIPGDIVECGVWRGGSMMAVILALQELGSLQRNLYLYDTFEGMTTRQSIDTSEYETEMRQKVEEGAYAVSQDEVQRNVGTLGYSESRIRYVKGPVEETLASARHEQIAVLRLDTDWYESTRAELEILFLEAKKAEKI
jgi:O-methyltransferase